MHWLARRAVLVLALGAGLGVGTGWILDQHANTTGSLVLESPREVLVTGAPGEAVRATFRLRNATEYAVVPQVVWRSCACDEYSLTPTTVPPQSSFPLVCPCSVPYFGVELIQEYALGLRERDPEAELRVFVRVKADESLPHLTVRPLTVQVHAATAQESAAGIGTARIDVSYSLPGQRAADPFSDLSFEFAGVGVSLLAAGPSYSGRESAYSGQLRLSFAPSVGLRGGSEVHGAIRSPGTPAENVTLLLPLEHNQQEPRR